MSAQPWFKFFPNDWRADTALRMCSPSARCLWIEMLCIMHEANPRGHLTVNGHPVDVRQLAIQAGMTVEEVRSGIAELDANGVFSRKADGTIFSRKMVRETRTSEEQRARAQKKWDTEKSKETDFGDAQNMPHKRSLRDSETQKLREGDNPPLTPLPFSTGDAFHKFWSEYPNKTGKGAAEKKFAKALERAGTTDPVGVIMLGLSRWKISRRWAEGFIPNPTTWLNQNRWNDEPEPFDGTPRPSPSADRRASKLGSMARGFAQNAARDGDEGWGFGH